MAPSRRSRMHRTRSEKRLALTPRDIEIFRTLVRYRYLRSTYLHAFAGGASETRFKERLGDLFHEGFIQRPAKQWEFASARYQPALYEMGEGAKRILREHGIDADEPRTFLAAPAHRQFAHSVLICECLASIELAVRERSDLRFIPWPEILARAPEETRTSAVPFRMPVAAGAVIPDGLFGLEYRREEKKTYRFFALEVDRGTMPIVRSDRGQTSYLGKLAAYRETIAHQTHKTHLGLPNLLVLTLTSGEARMTDMLERLDGRAGNSAAFLFKAVSGDRPREPMRQLLTEPWQRAGFPPLRIDESD